ncbi:MAG: GntR family transcriptional regulator [Planctomycetes bacterium]|nr:GntR family transcriptional regulator [Planctomycetota bacterium]
MIHHDGSSIAARAYQHIRSKVLCGDYPAGQRLVTRQLAVEIGASLNPVREALGRLAAEGIIDHVPGAGASVRQPQLDEILELYEFRQALEPFAAQKAAQFITAPELGVLKEVCARQHDLAESMRQSKSHLQDDELLQWFHHEERFHNTLIGAARNSHFDRTVRNSRVLTQLFHCHQTLGLKVDLGVAARTWGIHLRIVRALESGDADLAGSLMRTALAQGAQQTVLSSSHALRP